MPWSPRWRHVTQMHADGSGHNACAEASISRALMEYDPATPERMANAEWQLVRDIHDPANPATIWQLLDRTSVLGRGEHDVAGAGFTSGAGIEHILDAFDLAWGYVDGPSAAWPNVDAHELVLCWVDGVELAPPSFPADYFGGDWGYDHIILSLPEAGLYNDPLTVWPIRTDVRYQDGAVRNALGGVWVLPAPEPVEPVHYRIVHAAALKSYPNHLGGKANPVREQLPAGAVVTLTGQRTPHWVEVRAGDVAGWVLGDNVAA